MHHGIVGEVDVCRDPRIRHHPLGRLDDCTVRQTGLKDVERHIDLLRAPITVTYGTFETPDFQRQSRDFAAAVKAAGKPVELLEAPDYNHFEMCESFGNPYGPNGLAALKLMKLA